MIDAGAGSDARVHMGRIPTEGLKRIAGRRDGLAAHVHMGRIPTEGLKRNDARGSLKVLLRPHGSNPD